MASVPPNTLPPIHHVNWLGMRTLAYREIWRFMKVANQTVLAPVITALLFLAVMSLALGGNHRVLNGIPFGQFMAPGLIMMAIVQNAFANTSSSLMIAKMQGVIIDILMPPLSGTEITLAMMAGGVVRGLCVGVAVSIAVWVFVPVQVVHGGVALFYVVTASSLLALLGLLTGIWSQTFDQLSAITNYIITPLSFLSGTFYSVRDLPPIWHQLSHFDPFFYMIDGFRYALTDYSDGSIQIGMAVMIIANLAAWLTAQRLLTRGTRLKT